MARSECGRIPAAGGFPARRLRSGLLGVGLLVVGLLVVGLAVGCAKPTLLKVVSDPAGASVEIAEGGAVGKTPMDYLLTQRDLQALERSHGGERVEVPVRLSMRSYLTDLEIVDVPVGGVYTHFVKLEPRSEFVAITSEPEGVGVFELIVDDQATDAVRSVFDSDPMTALESHAKWITRHFIGTTPIRYRVDSDHPLDQNDVLLFQKAGFRSELAYYKERETRVHMIMMPQAPEGR